MGRWGLALLVVHLLQAVVVTQGAVVLGYDDADDDVLQQTSTNTQHVPPALQDTNDEEHWNTRSHNIINVPVPNTIQNNTGLQPSENAVAPHRHHHHHHHHHHRVSGLETSTPSDERLTQSNLQLSESLPTHSHHSSRKSALHVSEPRAHTPHLASKIEPTVTQKHYISKHRRADPEVDQAPAAKQIEAILGQVQDEELPNGVQNTGTEVEPAVATELMVASDNHLNDEELLGTQDLMSYTVVVKPSPEPNTPDQDEQQHSSGEDFDENSNASPSPTPSTTTRPSATPQASSEPSISPTPTPIPTPQKSNQAPNGQWVKLRHELDELKHELEQLKQQRQSPGAEQPNNNQLHQPVRWRVDIPKLDSGSQVETTVPNQPDSEIVSQEESISEQPLVVSTPEPPPASASASPMPSRIERTQLPAALRAPKLTEIQPEVAIGSRSRHAESVVVSSHRQGDKRAAYGWMKPLDLVKTPRAWRNGVEAEEQDQPVDAQVETSQNVQVSENAEQEKFDASRGPGNHQGALRVGKMHRWR
eukprot:c53507_g1_i1.p1 GENE.c53507_g1_i1~~c53507_g1_i1.p1  ORF type:complete len:540 (-),score=91.59 c53507_g1_i1:33-1631(-)